MRFRLTVLAACALALAACDDYDDDSDGVVTVAASTNDPFAPVDPLAGPPGVITSEVDPLDDTFVDPTLGTGVNPGVDPFVDDVPLDDDIGGPYFAPVPVPGSTFGVAGLYDASIRRPLGIDTRYVYITPDGFLVEYDYDLDPYGTGLNCYRRGLPLPLVRNRSDDYLLDGRAVRIVREDLGIGYAYVDILDDDRDGNITETLYYRYPRVSGLAVNDFGRCF